MCCHPTSQRLLLCQISCQMFVLFQLCLYSHDTPWNMWHIMYCKIQLNVVGLPGTSGILLLTYYILGHAISFSGILNSSAAWVLERMLNVVQTSSGAISQVKKPKRRIVIVKNGSRHLLAINTIVRTNTVYRNDMKDSWCFLEIHRILGLIFPPSKNKTKHFLWVDGVKFVMLNIFTPASNNLFMWNHERQITLLS